MDVDGVRRRPPRSTVLAVLRVLAQIDDERDAPDALRRAGAERRDALCEPVVVGRALELRLRALEADGRARCEIELESGDRVGWVADLADVRASGDRDVVVKRCPMPRLPHGRHRLEVRVGRRRAEATVIAAPARAPHPAERIWGLHCPLYALRTRRSWGTSDLTDLDSFATWARAHGAAFVGVLPMLAAFLDEPFDPSPYAPVSRLHWNELYVDAERTDASPEARALLADAGFRRELAALRRGTLVDYRRSMQAKRRVLELTARTAPRRREPALPELDRYATFRAACDRWGAPRAWPDAARRRLRADHVDPAARRYHVYVQSEAERQLRRVAAAADLYLDLPVGAHPDGYDVWSRPGLFATGMSAGAPPDTFFRGGQRWGFPPIVPEAGRRTGHEYFAASLRHHVRHARILRIDHVMGLHRLYWVPDGADAADGTYVTYPARELYAVVALEAARHGSVVVGEDLGTVPEPVRRSMRAHGLLRSYVLQLEALGGGPLRPPPGGSLASLNTHDLPPFAAYWREAGAFAGLGAPGGGKEPDGREALRACLAYLAASDARVVVASLEDLWGETRPQNVPGSDAAHPNWRRRTRLTLAGAGRNPDVAGLLELVDRLRRRPS